MKLKKVLSYFVPVALSVVLSFLLLTAVLERWQNQITDLFYADRDASSKVMIVEIDDASIQKIGAWPWNREVFANVVSKLSEEKTRIVGFDVVFSEEREGDDKFQESLSNSSSEIVLASKILGNELLYPLEKFIDLPNVYPAYANFTPDHDGKVRNAKLFSSVDSGCTPSLSYQILRLYFSEDDELDCSLGERKLGFSEFSVNETGIRINYLKVSGKYESVTVSDLLDGNYEKGIFKDKIVLIGSTAQDVKSNLNDNIVSPTDGNFIPGVEIHANTLQTVIENEFIYDLPLWTRIALLVASVLITYFFTRKLKIVWSIVFLIIFLILTLLFSFLLFDLGFIADFIYIPLGASLAWLSGIIWKYYERRSEVEELRKAFSTYVNPKLLAQILADPGKLKLGGEKKNMSVLFSDIRSFTSISEKLAPEDLVSFLNKYLEKVTNVILENNGAVDKFIGDAVMAFWGAPLEDKDHAYNACLSAVAFMKVIEEFKKETNLPAEIKVGIGINSGEMVVGNIGSQNRFDYTVLGDNVNLASRLEGLTKMYGVTVLVTESTINNLSASQRQEFNFRKVDVVQVKGKDKSVDIYELLLKKDDVLVNNYSEGFKLYEKGQFTKAKAIFEKLITKSNDNPSKVMLERCKEFVKSKPKKWKGVWVWSEK